jgi:hypothetical protein
VFQFGPRLELSGRWKQSLAVHPAELKVAVTAVGLEVSVREQLDDVPEHAPLHPVKTIPWAGVAVRVTPVPVG